MPPLQLYSEFDTNLLSLTVIPVLGFWKLLPTFGGCVITASSAALNGDSIDMEVQYTTSRPVPGLSGLRPLPRRCTETRSHTNPHVVLGAHNYV